MRNNVPFIPEIQLLITDTPKLDWMPVSEIKRGLEKYSKFVKHTILFVDIPFKLNFPNVQYRHDEYTKKAPHIIYSCIDKYTKLGDVVFDPFCGYSTVGICALTLRRKYIGIEINPDIYKIGLENLNVSFN